MANKKTLDLEPIITGLCYRKTETLTETEIRQAITNAMLNFGVEYVTTLPTGDNIKQKVYILPDTSGTAGNFGDIYVYDRTNTKWIHIDALKFNINDYLLIADIIDNLTSTNANKALSANQGNVLKALVDSKSASTHEHGNISNTGTLNSDISTVNKVVVTDSNNNVKTINKLPSDKVTHQDISGKVNVSDIKDNLTSTDVNKPLSAKQGKELKTLIDSKSNNGHTHTKSQITDFPSTITLNVTYDDSTTGTFTLYGSQVI